MARLQGVQRKRVDDAIRDAFDVDELNQILRYYFNINLSDISPPDNEKNTVFSLLETAENKGWTDRLLKALKKERPDNEFFLQQMDEALKVLESPRVEATEQQPASAPADTSATQHADMHSATVAPSAALGRIGRKPVAARWRILGGLGVLAGGAAGVAAFLGGTNGPQACGRGEGTVYIQYPDAGLEKQANDLRMAIDAVGFSAPATEKIKEQSPDQMEIRYFFPYQEPQVEVLNCILDDRGYEAIQLLVEGKEEQIEVWFGNNQSEGG